jgi:predicted metalloprotease with PDZ domain
MQIRSFLSAVALTIAFAGCANAQQPGASAPAPAGTVSGTRTNPRAPAASFGFALSLRSGEHPEVTGVDQGSPAAQAGLVPGDLIVSIDGQDTREPGRRFRDATPGRRYTLQVQRGSEMRTVVLVAGPPPAKP